MVTTWTKENRLEGVASIDYDENTVNYTFKIDDTWEFLIDSTYKLLIGGGLPSYDDPRYNYNGQLLSQWDTDDRNITTWTKETPNITTWTNETKI